jgi:hypothetical protein
MNAKQIKKRLLREQPFSVCIVYLTASYERCFLKKYGANTKSLKILNKHLGPMDTKLDDLLKQDAIAKSPLPPIMRIVFGEAEASLSVLNLDQTGEVLSKELELVKGSPLITRTERYGEKLLVALHLDIALP